MSEKELAINGGSKAIERDFPARGLIGAEEKDAVMALFDDCLATGNSFGYNGKHENRYCEEFAEFMGGGFADGVNSGTNAVYVALRALDPEPFTEVVVGAVTDPGGMMPIPLLNCVPVVADAAPGQYNTGPEQVEAAISPLTSAIVVAHIGGEPCDIEGIMAVAKKHDLPVVEDCSQSHGAKMNGNYVGTFGDVAAFSTMFGKHHCTGGQGGMVFTKSEELYKRCRWASDRGKPYGVENPEGNVIAALNNNLNDLAGVIGSCQLKKLPGIIARRQAFADALRPELEKLSSINIPELVPGSEHAYWWWRLEVDESAITCDKQQFCAALMTEGVVMNSNYSGALPSRQSWFKNRTVFGSSKYPWTAPEYKGDRDQQFPCPNAMATMSRQFNLCAFESWGAAEAAAIAKAFRKVNAAYAK